jgi:hypothetical protein
MTEKEIQRLAKIMVVDIKTTFAEDIAELEEKYGELEELTVDFPDNCVWIIADFHNKKISLFSEIGDFTELEGDEGILMRWSEHLQRKYTEYFGEL